MTQTNWIAGRYEILAEIGRGGMGLVARAYDHRLETEVAIKVLRQDLAKDSGDKDSLIKEARVLARLSHPSIVRLFDLAETEIGLMLILEYVRGPNLAQVLDVRERLTIDEFLHVARQVCAGLAAAHAEGVIHRDLKPPNLLVAPSLPHATGPEFLLNSKIKITDFGISKLLASKVHAAGVSASTDATTSAAGTPVFMAPEQFTGNPCTPATDVYALGVITYLALSGRPPFVSDDIRDLAFKHFRATADPIEDYSVQVNAVIQRALAKAPSDRFETALDFLNALETACLPAIPPPPPLPILEPDGLDRAAAWLGAHWWQLILGFVALVAAIVGIIVSQTPASDPTRFETTSKAARPSLGKIINLPADLDEVPLASTLPAPISRPPIPSRPGPRRAPHAIWTALLESDDFHSSATVDGVSPDGMVYIRDEAAKSLWAVNDSGLKWGFRAAVPSNQMRFGANMASWPDGSHVDFRDPGLVWLASCPSPKAACDGVVFNSAGAGGKNNQVPLGLRSPLTRAVPAASSFREDDAQNGHWPDDHPQLRYVSRLGSVTLSALDQGWNLPLDGRGTNAIHANGKWIVATTRNTIYSIDTAGRVEWTYTSPDAIDSMQVLPSGDLLLLTGTDHETIRAIHAGVARWSFNGHGWIRDFGAIDSTGALYLLSTSGNSLAFFGIDVMGKPMWSMLWMGLTSSSESLRLDDAGRLYLSSGRFEVDGKTRKGVVCLIDDDGPADRH